MRGFTLLELVVVSVIVAVLAATAVPAIGLLDRTRSASGTAEVGRVLHEARASAMVTWQPSGLRLDADLGTFARVRFDRGEVVPALDALGEEMPTRRLGDEFPGVGFSSITFGDGSSDRGTLWFEHTGEPSVRDESDASLIQAATVDAVILFENGQRITVHAGSGMIR